MKMCLAMISLFVLVFSVIPVEAKSIEVGENCTYKTIQEAVNVAEEGDVINVHAGIYSIDRSIVLKSDIELSGDPLGQTVLYTDSAEDINSVDEPAILYCNGVSNVTIHDVILKGPAKNLQDQHEKGGKSSIGGLREARNGIKIRNSDNIKIYNTRFVLLLSDGIRITHSKNIVIYDCIVDSAGHDSISNFKVSGVTIYNCLFSQMINTCVRVDNSESVSISNSTFKPALEGSGAGYIEMQHSADDVSINGNLFLESADPVIFTDSPKGGDVTITDNAYSSVDDLEDDYSPYSVSKTGNVLISEINESVLLNYGYSKKNNAVVSEMPPVESETRMNDAPDGREDMNNTMNVSNDMNETEPIEPEENMFINPNTLEFLIVQTESVANMSREANLDLISARSLMNGTAQEKQIGERYLTASELKIKYAKELLNLSEQSIKDSRNGTYSQMN